MVAVRWVVVAAVAAVAAVAGVGCGKTEPPAPPAKLTPKVEAQLAALGGTCQHLMRLGGEPKAAPEVMQCQGETSYVSVNHYGDGLIASIELALTGQPPELRGRYGKALEGIVGAEPLREIQARIPDSGKVIETPELVRAGGLKLMISAGPAKGAWRYDVTITW